MATENVTTPKAMTTSSSPPPKTDDATGMISHCLQVHYYVDRQVGLRSGLNLSCIAIKLVVQSSSVINGVATVIEVIEAPTWEIGLVGVGSTSVADGE